MIVRSFPFVYENLTLTTLSSCCSGCRVLSPLYFFAVKRKANWKELCLWTWSSYETTSNSNVSLSHHELRSLQKHGDIRTLLLLSPLSLLHHSFCAASKTSDKARNVPIPFRRLYRLSLQSDARKHGCLLHPTNKMYPSPLFGERPKLSVS